MKYFKTVTRSFIILLCLALPLTASAAELLVAGPGSVQSATSAFSITISVDAKNELINVVEGELVIPDTFKVESVNEGNSVISLWVRQPKIGEQSDTKEMHIPFSGLIPGGASINKGRLFSVNLVPKISNGTGTIRILSGQAYISDGKGTKIPLTSKPFAVNIAVPEASPEAEPVTTTTQTLPKDTTPPETFAVALGQNEYIYENRWFVAFSAADQGSGIAYFEVQESKSETLSPSGWIRAQNPYVLEDQNRTSYIFIKTVDGAGNERIEKISPAPLAKGYPQILFWCILLLMGTALLYLWRRQKSTLPQVQ